MRCAVTLCRRHSRSTAGPKFRVPYHSLGPLSLSGDSSYVKRRSWKCAQFFFGNNKTMNLGNHFYVTSEGIILQRRRRGQDNTISSGADIQFTYNSSPPGSLPPKDAIGKCGRPGKLCLVCPTYCHGTVGWRGSHSLSAQVAGNKTGRMEDPAQQTE